MSNCFNCKNNCCSKNFIGLVNSFKNNDSNLFNQILLNEEERQRIIQYGGESYIEKIDGNYYMALNPDRSCKAFKDNKCMIYKNRPDVCKLYPFYFDPFGGMFVDKNCSCLEDSVSIDKEEMYDLFFKRLKLFAKIEGRSHIEERMNKTDGDEISKDLLKSLVSKIDYLSFKNGNLCINNIDLIPIINKYKTPLSVGFIDIIEKRINYLKEIFNKYLKQEEFNGKYYYAYATKASYFAEVVYAAYKFADMLEVSSEYDIEIIEELIKLKNLKPKTIICNGFKNKKYVENIKRLTKLGVSILYIINEPEEYELIKNQNIKNIEIGLRYDCERESRISKDNFDNFELDKTRFGMERETLLKLAEKITNDNNYNVTTFHFHLGGKINNIEKYVLAVEEILKIFIQAKSICQTISNLDIGGGFPILYGENEDCKIENIVREFSKLLGKYQKKYNVNFNIIGEHGRYTVAEHGVYIFKIDKVIKKNNINWFVINNSLMSYLPDLWAKQEDFIVLPINNWDKTFIKGKLSGGTCDESDVFFINNKNKTYFLPDSKDLYVAILGIGAYQEMISGCSAFSHCMIPKANELIITNKKEIFIKTEIKKSDKLKRLSYTKKYLHNFN